MRSTKTAAALLLLCASSLSLSPALAAPATRKFIEQKPMFDTSVLPQRSHFELNVKHTDFIYPTRPTFLHGKTKMVDLQAEENDHTLRGRVAEETSPIHTTEHGVKSVFHHDLFSMIPKIAPDLTRQLEAQISQSQKRLAAQVEQEQPLMREQMARKPVVAIPELPAQASVPSIPMLPARVSMPKIPTSAVAAIPKQARVPAIAQTPNPSPDLSSQIDQERSKVPRPTQASTKQPKASMPANPGNGGGPASMGDGGPPLPPIDLDALRHQAPVEIPKNESTTPAAAMPQTKNQVQARMPQTQIAIMPGPQSDGDVSGRLKKAQDEMQAQMAAAGRMNAASRDVNAQLMKAREVASQATPQMNAIMTHVRRLPTPDIQAMTAVAKSLPQGAGERTILWDAWHAKFAKLSQGPLLKAFERAGGPFGANTVSITVSPDCRVRVSLTKSGNKQFDSAVVEAYQSLDKNPGLKYPAGSMRTSVTFLIDNEHKTAGTASGVQSHTSVGDKEVFKLKR